MTEERREEIPRTPSDTGAGTLYVCGTPIGNLEDITQRCLRVLGEVDVIAAEDTRHTRKLLAAYNLKTPMISLHEHNESVRTVEILELLTAGKDVALVSDAGMPAISDPGAIVVRACVEAGFDVVPVPGPTAFVAALVASGLPTDRFVFEGFLPRKRTQRKERLAALASEPRTMVFYEAPHRLRRTLEDMFEVWGERSIVLARELTKLHEEFVRCPLSEAIRWCEQGVRGEFVLVVEGAIEPKGEASGETESLEQELQDHLERGMSIRDAVKRVAEDLRLPRREVYEAALRLKGE